MAALSDHEFEGLCEFLRLRFKLEYYQETLLRELRSLGMLRWPEKWERTKSAKGANGAET